MAKHACLMYICNACALHVMSCAHMHAQLHKVHGMIKYVYYAFVGCQHNIGAFNQHD